MPPLEFHEEKAKEEKRLKTLTSNKLLIRIPILSEHIKAGNNSCTLKNEIRNTTSFLSA